MGGLRLVCFLGAVLFMGPSPCFGQGVIAYPAVEVYVVSGVRPLSTVYGGSSYGQVAYFNAGLGRWQVSEMSGSPQVDAWQYLGSTGYGDHTWRGVVYAPVPQISPDGMEAILSWAGFGGHVAYQCVAGGPVYYGRFWVGPGTRTGIYRGAERAGRDILGVVVIRCGESSPTNQFDGAWLTNSYQGRWYDLEAVVATQATGGIITTGRITVGDKLVRELTIVSNTVSVNEVLSNEVRVLVGGVTGSTAQQVMGAMLGGVSGGGGGSGVQVNLTNQVHVTNTVNWAEGHEYAKGQLVFTNWGWVVDSVDFSVSEALGRPGELSGVSGGHGVAAPSWSIPVRLPSGVWSWDFQLSVWTGSIGGLVKRVLEVCVLLGLWFVLHRQIVDDLRSAWGAPQARSAGQTVLGTGSQLAGALVAAAAILATLLTLTAAVLAWFLGGVGYPHAWVGELSLPSGLLGQFLRVGPWEVIVSSLTVWVGVWLARPYWIALTHGVVRFITGV